MTETTTQIIEQVAETTEKAMQYEFAFTPDKFIDALPIMGKGMLGIFIVTTVIILVVGALNKLSAPKAKKDKEQK